MRVDFTEVEDVEEFASVPEGTYLCKVAEVHSSTTREGIYETKNVEHNHKPY